MDDKGRITLGKSIRHALHLDTGATLASIRHALHLDTGATLAWITIGEMVMLLPQDPHLAELMEAAQAAFERGGLKLDHLDAELEEVRDEVVTKHWNEQLAARTGLRVAHPARFLAGLRP
jgi:hypothetical protein